MNQIPAITNITLYSLLAIANNATNEEIVSSSISFITLIQKNAYKRIALLVHPDKNQNDPDAAEKFRNLNQAYKILSDPEKRKVYDDLGEYEENEVGNINDTYEYFREIYPRIKLQDIDSFSKNYKRSLMEREDLIDFYEEKKGNMTQLLEYIPLSENKDIKRFLNIYEMLIEEGVLEKYDHYPKTKNSIKQLKNDENDSKEAEELFKNLQQQIMKNKKQRGDSDSLYEQLGIIVFI